MASGRNRGKKNQSDVYHVPEGNGLSGSYCSQQTVIFHFQPKLVLLRARAKSQLQVRAKKRPIVQPILSAKSTGSLRLRGPKSMYVGSGSKAGLPLIFSLRHFNTKGMHAKETEQGPITHIHKV